MSKIKLHCDATLGTTTLKIHQVLLSFPMTFLYQAETVNLFLVEAQMQVFLRKLCENTRQYNQILYPLLDVKCLCHI